MIERKDKNYVNCPVCGKSLMKCYGNCEIEIKCNKCDRDIVVAVNEGQVTVFENRRESSSVRNGAVRVSIHKEGKKANLIGGRKCLNTEAI